MKRLQRLFQFQFQSGVIKRTTEYPARMGTEHAEFIMSPFKYVVIKRFFSVFGVFRGTRFQFQSGAIKRRTTSGTSVSSRFQFQSGAIKRNQIRIAYQINIRFNSNLVRLSENPDTEQPDREGRFNSNLVRLSGA